MRDVLVWHMLIGDWSIRLGPVVASRRPNDLVYWRRTLCTSYPS
jgi:hypothetical protein